MNNFENFMKVAMEAQNSIEELKTHINNKKAQRKNIQQKKYETVHQYWMEVAEMLASLQITNHKPMRTPVKTGVGRNVYVTIYKSESDVVELGLYSTLKESEKPTWYRWMQLKPDYIETRRDAPDSYWGLEVIETMINKWDEIQPELDNLIKEMITNIMADRIKEAEQEYKKISSELDME